MPPRNSMHLHKFWELAVLTVLLVSCGHTSQNDPYEGQASNFFPKEASQRSLSSKLKFPKDEEQSEEKNSKLPSTSSSVETAASDHFDDIDEKTAIDIILAANRAGRKIDLSDLDGDLGSQDLRQLTSDPKIRAEISAGNEAQARNYIRDKLCDLGLMPCGGADTLSKKHGYGGGDYLEGGGGSYGLGIPLNEIKLVQPVAIKPVGPPISAIPLEKPFKSPAPPPIYGPPLNQQSSYGKQLPLPVYTPPHVSQKAPPGVLPPFNSKPYDYGGPINSKPLIGPLYNSGGKIVEHIHHHIHHTPVSGNSGIGTYGVIGSSGGYAGGFDEYGAAQKPAISLATPGGTSIGSFPQRKINDLDFRSSLQNDCFCVPINQCASFDIVQQGSSGREVTQGTGTPNSGLVGYNIDPRHKHSQFEIESNATDSRHRDYAAVREPRTQRRKREEPKTVTPSEPALAESPKVAGQTQGRFISSLLQDPMIRNLTRFAGYDFGEDSSQLVKMEGHRLRVLGRLLGFEPTWGVSFGLPGGYPQAGGGYPLNPFGTDPAVNPYNGGGIDLGPISINPLVSFQKTKDKDKTKVFKPLVNLHITPNPSLIYGIKGLFHQKKAAKAHKFGIGTHHVHHPYPSPVPVPVPVPVLPLVHQHEHYHHQYPISYGWGWPSSSYPITGQHYHSKGWSPNYTGGKYSYGYGSDAYANGYGGGYGSDAYAQAYATGGYAHGYSSAAAIGGFGGYRAAQKTVPSPNYASLTSNQYQRDAGASNVFANSQFDGDRSVFKIPGSTNSGSDEYADKFNTASVFDDREKFAPGIDAGGDLTNQNRGEGELTNEDSALIQELLADGQITKAELDELSINYDSNQDSSQSNNIRRGRTLFPLQDEPRSESYEKNAGEKYFERRVLPTGNVETRLPISATGPDAPTSNGGRLSFAVKQNKGRVNFPDEAKERSRSRRQVRSSPDFARVLSQSAAAQKQRQLNLGGACPNGYVCCRRPIRPSSQQKQPTNSLINSINSFVPGQCGQRNARGITGRVTNPNPATEGESDYGEWPWQVAILKKDGYDNVYVCGGTVIDERHVVTAAHCLKGLQPNDLRVRLGEWDVNHETEFYPHVERDVAGFALHPDFYAGNLFNDIAVMRLEGAVDFRQNPHISPVCLPPINVELGGQRCLVTGWGKDAWGDKGKYQNILKEVDVPVLRHFDCEQKLKRTRLGPDFVLHSGFLCAGGEEGRDACKGDGGGPLVCNVQGTFVLAGIVSWGVGCGHREVPGVYVKVSHYREWLQETIKV